MSNARRTLPIDINELDDDIYELYAAAPSVFLNPNDPNKHAKGNFPTLRQTLFT